MYVAGYVFFYLITNHNVFKNKWEQAIETKRTYLVYTVYTGIQYIAVPWAYYVLRAPLYIPLASSY